MPLSRFARLGDVVRMRRLRLLSFPKDIAVAERGPRGRAI